MSVLAPPPVFSPVQDTAGVLLPIWSAFFIAIKTGAATSQTSAGIAYFDATKITSTANATLDGSGNAVFAGTLGVTSDFKINTNKFVVTASTGAVAIAGDMNVAIGHSVAIGDGSSNAGANVLLRGSSSGRNWQLANELSVSAFTIMPSTANGGSTFTTPVVTIEDGGRTLFGGVVNLKNYTVATLPGGTRGDIAYVTNALAPTFLAVIVGGGAVVAPVFYDGSAWVSF
jgi:hypothetical protein